jgi:hypothetical protein
MVSVVMAGPLSSSPEECHGYQEVEGMDDSTDICVVQFRTTVNVSTIASARPGYSAPVLNAALFHCKIISVQYVV